MGILKKILSYFITIGVVGILIAGFIYMVNSTRYDPAGNVCIPGNPYYTNHCDNIGRMAFTVTHDGQVIKHGVITGVVWRPRGQEISSVGQRRRFSDVSSYYYTFKRPNQRDWMEPVSEVRVR